MKGENVDQSSGFANGVSVRPCTDCPFKIRPGDEVFVVGSNGVIGNVPFPVLLVEFDRQRVLVRGNKSQVWVPLDRVRRKEK